MSLEKLQDDLTRHDFDNWQHPSGFPTDRHNALHAGKTVGKVLAHLELIEDQKLPEDTPLDPMTVADLAIEAIRFANNGDYNLEEAIATRMQQLRERAVQQGLEP